MINMIYNNPLVTVVMPLYNKEKEVLRAVNSVTNQTFSDFELIIVNDGSTDNSSTIVRSIDDNRIRIINQDNEGVSAARNRGICEAQTDLIAFIDADDAWEPHFIETILNLKEKFPICKVYATNYFIRLPKNGCRLPIIRRIGQNFHEGILKNYFEIASNSDPPLYTSAIAVDKSAIQSIGGFPLGIKGGEDLLTWAKLAMKYEIAYSMRPSVNFWMPTVRDREVRTSDKVDMVEKKLLVLLRDSDLNESQSVKKYISIWHKIRASTYLQRNEPKKALIQTLKALKFNKTNLKLYGYLLFCIIPDKISAHLFLWFLRINSINRKKINDT
jgi:glycosyltransferase involved in cell wall biosynthesis